MSCSLLSVMFCLKIFEHTLTCFSIGRITIFQCNITLVCIQFSMLWSVTLTISTPHKSLFQSSYFCKCKPQKQRLEHEYLKAFLEQFYRYVCGCVKALFSVSWFLICRNTFVANVWTRFVRRRGSLHKQGYFALHKQGYFALHKQGYFVLVFNAKAVCAIC